MKYDLSTHKTDSKPTTRGKCNNCSTDHGNVTYSDGHTYCFNCTSFVSGDGTTPMTVQTTPTHGGRLTKGDTYGAIPDRYLKDTTTKKYGVTTEVVGGKTTKHWYPYHTDNGSLIANKVRQCADKNFFIEGDMGRATLFGQHLFPKGGLFVTLYEGEVDAMSGYQLTGSKYASVSVRNGSSGAVKDVKMNFEYLDSFETVVICFDNDEAGKKAEAKVASLFSPNKCKIVRLDLKDANEYLKAGKFEDFTKAWWAASVYTPAGIINLADIGDALFNEDNQTTVLYPWDGMNTMLYGLRTGELVTLTAGTGTGKSSVLRELQHHFMKVCDDNIGVLALEENINQTCWHIMSVEANARLNIKEIRDKFPKDELKEYQKKTVGGGKFFGFDHFGSLDNDEILSRIRYMIKALGCRWIFLDHLSILVSGQEGGDERRSIDILMTRLRSMVEETQCGMVLVSHLKRTSTDKGAEDGKEISIGHLRGSQSIAQLSDAVIAMERQQQAATEKEANTTTMRILKNRYSGMGGVATYLGYDKDTGRLYETVLEDEDDEFTVFDG